MIQMDYEDERAQWARAVSSIARNMLNSRWASDPLSSEPQQPVYHVSVAMADFLGLTDSQARWEFHFQDWGENYDRIVDMKLDPAEVLTMLRLLYE